MIKEDVFPEIESFKVEEYPYFSFDENIFAFPDTPAAYLKSGRRVSGHRLNIIGLHPFLVFRSKGPEITIYGRYKHEFSGDPLSALSEVLKRYRNVVFHPSLPVCPAALGAFSYDLKNMLEVIPRDTEDAMDCPDIHFTFFRNYYIFDTASGDNFTLEIKTDARPEGLPSMDLPGETRIGEIKSDFTEDEFKRAVEKVKQHIIAGDIYQANISQQFSAGFSGHGWDVFKAVDKLNPAPMSAYLDCGDFRIISSSPERFLRRRGYSIESRPIKGTRPRGKTPEEDEKLKMELLESEKDRAELAMIVDLVRNDLGKTAKPGSVSVPQRRFIEKYPNVFHSLSLVRASADRGLCPVDIIASCFPGGSVTGCPKVQAMKVIEKIEKHRRGFYCGSIGYIGFDGGFDLNIAIRTFIQAKGKLFFNLGGGIVYDSDPQSEYDETIHKGRSMFQAVKSGIL